MKHLSLILAVAIHAVYAATAAIPLTHADGVWYGPIEVGIPPKTHTVVFDTGIADLLLPSASCSNCGSHTTYDPSTSSTAQHLGKNFSLQFGDGTALSGEQFTDTVSIGGLTATSQTLGAATAYPSSLSDSSPDGILGMAFPSVGHLATPVVQTLIAEGQLGAGVFSFKLAASGSELYMGGANSALYTGHFTYIPVTVQGLWQANVDAIEINGQTVLSNIDAVVDTGSTLTILSPSEAATFYNAAGGTDASSTVGSGYYTFPCDSFPSVAFTFGGASFNMSVETLNLGQVSSGSRDCVASIIGQDTGASFAIIGTSFLQNVYTSFDVENSRIGFAALS